ncbi:MAG: creatininase family protein [Deltaproteobacteria bacterium]|nr:creatininase family protein [Deltaproteobacteria bacterium]
MTSVRLDELTTFEVQRLLSDPDKRCGLLLPVGCTEQHGPNLPLGCDTAIARGAARNAAENLLAHPQYGAVVMPDLAYTPSPGAESIPGTVAVNFDLLGQSLSQIISAALRSPWRFVALINSHAHNHGRVIEASIAGAQGSLGRPVPIVVINLYEFAHLGNGLGMCPGSHAGELELALYHYYAGPLPTATPVARWVAPRARPNKIYGLDLLPRSNAGILSEQPPNIDRALAVSTKLGQAVDQAVLDALLSNLDTYFSCWS